MNCICICSTPISDYFVFFSTLPPSFPNLQSLYLVHISLRFFTIGRVVLTAWDSFSLDLTSMVCALPAQECWDRNMKAFHSEGKTPGAATNFNLKSNATCVSCSKLQFVDKSALTVIWCMSYIFSQIWKPLFSKVCSLNLRWLTCCIPISFNRAINAKKIHWVWPTYQFYNHLYAVYRYVTYRWIDILDCLYFVMITDVVRFLELGNRVHLNCLSLFFLYM